MSSLVATSEKIRCRPRRWRDIGRRSFQALGERGDEFRFLLLQHGIIADALGRSDGRIPLRFDEQGLSWESHSWIQKLLKKRTQKMLLEWEIRTFKKFELSIWSEGMAYTCQNQDENEFPQDYLIILPYSNNHPTRWSPNPPPSPTLRQAAKVSRPTGLSPSFLSCDRTWWGVATKVPPLKICEASPRARPGPMGYP